MIQDDSKKNNLSFSAPISHMVTMAFGAAFLLLFVAGVLLLLISGDMEGFYLRIFILFVTDVILFAIVSIYLDRKLRMMFQPIDRLAVGLIREEVLVDSRAGDLKAFADSLKKQAQNMDALNRELQDAREEIQDVSRESRESKDEQHMLMSRAMIEMEKIRKRQEDILKSSTSLEESLQETLPIEQQLGKERESLYRLSDKLKNSARKNEMGQQDIAREFDALQQNYDLMVDIQKDSDELAENIYTEIASIQSQAAQINLFAMNTSLEIARNGGSSISAITALDEIKELSSKLGAHTDDVQLLVIRMRNAMKLSADQMGECREKSSECTQAIRQGELKNAEVYAQIDQMLQISDRISDDITALENCLYNMQLFEEIRQTDTAKMQEASDRLFYAIHEWKKQVD